MFPNARTIYLQRLKKKKKKEINRFFQAFQGPYQVCQESNLFLSICKRYVRDDKIFQIPSLYFTFPSLPNHNRALITLLQNIPPFAETKVYLAHSRIRRIIRNLVSRFHETTVLFVNIDRANQQTCSLQRYINTGAINILKKNIIEIKRI